MPIATCLTPERIARMKAAGFWPDRTLLDHFDAVVSAHPDKIAVTALEVATGRRTSLSFRQLELLSRRVAAGLIRMGIRRGDVVSVQLPNRIEFVLLHLACLRCGAITNPLMPFLRERELAFMLSLAESRLIVAPQSFRQYDYAPMLANLAATLPGLDYLLLDAEGDRSFAERLLATRWEDEVSAEAFAARRPHADDVIEILYTSGTTGEPKGVMHTSNTMLSSLPHFARRLRLDGDSIVFMPSPLAHQTGFIYGMVLAIALGAKCVLQDVWNAEAAAQLIQDEGCSYTMASTPFLSDLTDQAARRLQDLSSFKVFLSAGAPIPSALVQRARETLGAAILSGWGMSENGSVTSTAPDDPEDKAVSTDGWAFESMELQVVDADGQPLPCGAEGRLQARGAGNFVGYLKRPDAYAVDADGWFETGDVARMDAEGYLRITGRAKDIIIRGGENIPVVEIENLLYRLPGVRDVALVGIPDPRLGERACAVVTLQPGQSLTFRQMIDFLEDSKVARQYFPERLEIVEAMPRTPSGKIQKFRLREAIAASSLSS